MEHVCEGIPVTSFYLHFHFLLTTPLVLLTLPFPVDSGMQIYVRILQDGRYFTNMLRITLCIATSIWL